MTIRENTERLLDTAQQKEEVVLRQLENTKRVSPSNHSRELVALDVGEFLAREFPPRRNLLDPWLPSQGLTMIHAPRGVGKTHCSLAIAYAVASGSTFLHWSAPQPAGVLFLDGEMPAVVLQKRLAAIVAASDVEPTAPLRIVSPDLQGSGMPDLSTDDGQAQIECNLDGIELIVVDNISTLCRTGRENEAESWVSVQGRALRMRSSGRSVLFVHHGGKGGQQRGTSRREDILDTVINLRRPADYRPEEGAVFEVHFEKSRGIYGDDVQSVEARLNTGTNDLQFWTTRSVHAGTFERVIALNKDGLTQNEIANELDINKSNVSRHIKRAREEGRIS